MCWPAGDPSINERMRPGATDVWIGPGDQMPPGVGGLGADGGAGCWLGFWLGVLVWTAIQLPSRHPARHPNSTAVPTPQGPTRYVPPTFGSRQGQADLYRRPVAGKARQTCIADLWPARPGRPVSPTCVGTPDTAWRYVRLFVAPIRLFVPHSLTAPPPLTLILRRNDGWIGEKTQTFILFFTTSTRVATPAIILTIRTARSRTHAFASLLTTTRASAWVFCRCWITGLANYPLS